MSLAEEVRQHFAGFRFGDPCLEIDIQRAEDALGEVLPDVLRELYLAFNGFLGPTDSVLFWPLFESEWGGAGLVEMNRFLRDGDEFPQSLLSQCLFFGDGGGGPCWGIKADMPGKVILWDAEWGEDFEVVGESPLEAWSAEKKLYDELSEPSEG